MYAMAVNVPAAADIPASAAATAVAMFDDLVRYETRLYNAVGDGLRRRHGIVAPQFEFLRYIRDRPDSRVGDLAAAFVIGVGATSKGINRLESSGWVRRVRDPADGRSSFLELTDAGRTLVDAAEHTFTEQLAALLSDLLDPGQLAGTAATLALLRSELERTDVGAPVG
jgi:DNA-binding MarR family transcriptional regulator